MSSMQNDESMKALSTPEPISSSPEGDAPQKGRPPRGNAMRRVFRWLGRGIVGMVGLTLITVGGSYVFLRTDAGERWLTSTINGSLQSLPSGLSGSIESFSGPLLSEAHIKGLVLRDKQGEWLTAREAVLRIDWSALPSAFVIAELAAESPVFLRTPVLEPAAQPDPEPAAPAMSPQEAMDTFSAFLKEWPSWLPQLRIDSLALRSADVRRAVANLPFVVSMEASASAAPEGIKAALDIRREDGPLPADAFNRRASLSTALSPDLMLKLDAKLSDLGFASAFVPASAAKIPALSFSLNGDAPVADWKLRCASRFRDLAVSGDEAASTLLSLHGDVALQALSSTPKVNAQLKAASGALTQRFWAMAGQKDGSLALGLNASASADDTVDARADIALDLSHMQWGTPELAALLGKDVSAKTAAVIHIAKDGSLDARLEKLDAKSAHLLAEASGTASLDKGDLASPASRTDVSARFRLVEAADLLPELSGDIDAHARIKGAFSALAAELGLRGSRLTLPGLELKDMDVMLSMPSIDAARLTTGTVASKSSGPLMNGHAKASLSANEQPVSLLCDWQADMAKGLSLALDKLELYAGENAVTGRLSALLPSGKTAPAKDTVAAMLGQTLPLLDGALSIDVKSWETLSALSGLALSGEPVNAALALETSSSKGATQQAFRLESDIPSFQIKMDGKQVALSKAAIESSGSDLWGRPSVLFSSSFDSLMLDSTSIGPVSLFAEGGLDSARVQARSAGAVSADIDAEWKPGKLLIEKLDASVDPKQFALPEGATVGLKLNAPAELTYSATSASLPSLSATLLPSGKLDVSGTYSPSAMKGHVLLESLLLEHFQPFAPALAGGEAALNADISGTPHAPVGNFKLNLRDVSIRGASLPAINMALHGDLAMKGKRRTLEAQLDLPEHTQKALGLSRFSLNASVPFTSPAKGAFSQPDLKAPLNAVFSLAGQLEGLWKLVPSADMRLSGLADIDARVAGSASAPVVTAHASIEKGRFSDIMNGVGLRDIQLKLDAKELDVVRKKAAERVTVDLSAKAGSKGTLQLGGWVDPATMALNIDGSMKSLAPLRRQDAKIMLSGTLGVQGTVASPIVRADITVDKGQIQLEQLPGSSIPTLEIWTPEEERRKEEAPAVPGRLDVRVTIPNQFFVRGYGLDCEWGGQLNINAPLDKPAVSGELKAVRGTLDILGKNFKLANGQVRFDGSWPVSPLIDIDMEYVASSLTANILVSGTASKPKLTLTSQPVLPQDEILSRIMFGQSSATLSHVQALQLASGAASLAGFGGPGVMGMGRKLLGVDVFKINSDNDGEDSDVSNTSLEMGTYVRDNVYVGFEQGIGKNSESGAVVEIELRPGLEAQAKASGNETEVGLEWKKNY